MSTKDKKMSKKLQQQLDKAELELHDVSDAELRHLLEHLTQAERNHLLAMLINAAGPSPSLAETRKLIEAEIKRRKLDLE